MFLERLYRFLPGYRRLAQIQAELEVLEVEIVAEQLPRLTELIDHFQKAKQSEVAQALQQKRKNLLAQIAGSEEFSEFSGEPNDETVTTDTDADPSTNGPAKPRRPPKRPRKGNAANLQPSTPICEVDP